MTDRAVHVYRLNVEYPSTEPPMPPSWADSADPERPPATWPAARKYLSESGANTRARLLRSMGCTVTITRSQPVVFETPA